MSEAQALERIQKTFDLPDAVFKSGDAWTYRKQSDAVVYDAPAYGDPLTFRRGMPIMGEGIFANLEESGLRVRAKK